jgi:hypothetical protein
MHSRHNRKAFANRIVFSKSRSPVWVTGATSRREFWGQQRVEDAHYIEFEIELTLNEKSAFGPSISGLILH